MTTLDWRFEPAGRVVTFAAAGWEHRTTMEALAALVRAAERIIEERDTGRPDPVAWIELRNAVRREGDK